ncbi:MAG: DUF21 domain-containing protein [Phycisphaerales bacterium]
MLSLTLAGYFFFALLISFCCSLFEATLLSVTPTQIESMRKTGKRSGEILWDLRDRVDRPLIAILTLNTVANMFGAAGVGNEAGRLARVNGASDQEQLWVTIASGVLTLAILICSEIVPKTLGAVLADSRAAGRPPDQHARYRPAPDRVAAAGHPETARRAGHREHGHPRRPDDDRRDGAGHRRHPSARLRTHHQCAQTG